MYPFASLPENLTAFCAALRREHGFRVGTQQLHDAARALFLTRISDERAVRDTLRPILSTTFEQVIVFDRAFRAFFHPQAMSGVERPPRDEGRSKTSGPTRTRAGETGAIEPAHRLEKASGTDVRVGVVVDLTGPVREAEPALLRSSYSPIESEGEPPDLAPVDREWRDAAALFTKRVERALSRRWKPAPRGPRFDLRRTLRSSLHTGGEPLLPRWRARPRLRPRFVFIVDGSRSMAPYTAPALRTAVAIASVTAAIEVFAFSTALERITDDVRRAAAGERRHPPKLHHAWGGGTGIGLCLRDLVHRYGTRTLGRDTVVVIASDGLDVGAPEILGQTMAELHRRSAAIIWLNPLTVTPGYEPTATGMRTVRAAVTTFSWVGDAAALRRLAGVVRVRS